MTLSRWALSGSSLTNQAESLPGAIGHSVGLAGLSRLATVAAALPIAILAVRSGSRPARSLSRLTYLGFALPGIVIALAFVFIGARYLTPLYQTLPLLILAMVIRHLARGVSVAEATLMQVSPRLEEAARSLARSIDRSIDHRS